MEQTGEKEIPGPASITHFELSDNCWTRKHSILQKLCLQVREFMFENPEIAERVEISVTEIRSTMVKNR